MGTILISPNTEEVEDPIIFLAGPVNGAPDWQSDAIGHLSLNESIHIVSPRQARDESVPLSAQESKKQIEWEQHYLQKAMRDGVVLFWFAKPLLETKPLHFAQQSFFELGDILAKTQGKDVVCAGIEEGFPGSEYLRATLQMKYPNLKVRASLSEVCDDALRLIRTQYI